MNVPNVNPYLSPIGINQIEDIRVEVYTYSNGGMAGKFELTDTSVS